MEAKRNHRCVAGHRAALCERRDNCVDPFLHRLPRPSAPCTMSPLEIWSQAWLLPVEGCCCCMLQAARWPQWPRRQGLAGTPGAPGVRPQGRGKGRRMKLYHHPALGNSAGWARHRQDASGRSGCSGPPVIPPRNINSSGRCLMPITHQLNSTRSSEVPTFPARQHDRCERDEYADSLVSTTLVPPRCEMCAPKDASEWQARFLSLTPLLPAWGAKFGIARG